MELGWSIVGYFEYDEYRLTVRASSNVWEPSKEILLNSNYSTNPGEL